MQWTPAQIRLLRTAGLCLPQQKFAKELGFAKRTIGNAERGSHPPSLAMRCALDQALAQATDAQRERFLAALNAQEAADRHQPTDRVDPAVVESAPQRPAATEAALVSAADESASLLTWIEASNVGDLTLEQMRSELRWIAHSYLKLPTLPLFTRARAIRDRAFTLLAGHQRTDQTRDLYAVAGWALTLLAWISTDLGRPDAANTHARAAWLCAGNADHHGLRVWIRATQHTAAFWEHHFLDAARYAEDGLRYGAGGSAEAFLASALALDLAKAGQCGDARTALARADFRRQAIAAELTG